MRSLAGGGWVAENRISALIRRDITELELSSLSISPSAPLPPPSEDTMKNHPPASQEESPHQAHHAGILISDFQPPEL